MSKQTSGIPMPYRANTGMPCYDSIQFSGAPNAVVMESSAAGINIVKHLNVAAKPGERVQSTRCRPDYDTLVINVTEGGHYSRRKGRSWIKAPIRRNDVSLIPAGCDTVIEYPAEQSGVLISFRRGVIGDLVEQMGTCKTVPLVHARTNLQLARLSWFLVGEIRLPGFAADLLTEGVMRAMMRAVLFPPGRPDPDDIGRTALTPNDTRRVQQYIDDHFGDTISLDSLANIAGMSSTNFSGAYKAATGQAPYQVLCNRRMEEARRLLVFTDQTLKQIALLCGFNSEVTFATAFERATRISPLRYRDFASG